MNTRPTRNSRQRANRECSLHYRATLDTDHEGALGAIAGQTRGCFSSFRGWVERGLRAAKDRRKQLTLPWAPVDEPGTWALEPLDERWRVDPGPPRVRVGGLDAGITFDASTPLMLVDESRTVRVTAVVHRASDHALVETSEPVDATTRAFWGGREVFVEPVRIGEAPIITSADGTPRPMVSLDRHDGEYVAVGPRGAFDAGLALDGVPVVVHPVSPWDALTMIVDGDGHRLAVRQRSATCDSPPASDVVHGDNGLRFSWAAPKSRPRRGVTVRLELPDDAGDDAVDPRHRFFEFEPREVIASPPRQNGASKQQRVAGERIRVFGTDRERFELVLERLPDQGHHIGLAVDTRALHQQRALLRRLVERPLPHQRPLLQLAEDPKRTRWSNPDPASVDTWYALTDPTRDGTMEQREFVQRALATPDFMLLEGPPGSGKTTAICELIQQLVRRGQRVLMCATTNVAVDNVLERLVEDEAPVDAVRLGRADRADEAVAAWTIDARISGLLDAWERAGVGAELRDRDRTAAARRAVVTAANVVFSTTTSLHHHPGFAERQNDQTPGRPPLFDVLIVDEASKTRVTEFLVPALRARRYIVVGDVRQLPPFTDRDELAANLAFITDGKRRPVGAHTQRACLIANRLADDRRVATGVRWLSNEPADVHRSLARELVERGIAADEIVRVSRGAERGAANDAVPSISLHTLHTSSPSRLRLFAARYVLIDADVLRDVVDMLPDDLAPLSRLEVGDGHPFHWRSLRGLTRAGRLGTPLRERGRQYATVREVADHERDWLGTHTWAGEMGWRMTRLHELKRGSNEAAKARLEDDLRRLAPADGVLDGSLADLASTGLPGVLEVLQDGVEGGHSRRRSVLTDGIHAAPEAVRRTRFARLSYQHRMHADIADWPRRVIYDNAALHDANTLDGRDTAHGWTFTPWDERRVWLHVDEDPRGGVNRAEIAAAARYVQQFLAWAEDHPRLDGDGRVRPWQLACLSFYSRQADALGRMLARATGSDGRTRFTAPNAVLVSGTVDRFQGREADTVVLSLRNRNRVGFMDSPNRLNVAVTRARRQLVVVGNRQYFARCGVLELEGLANHTPAVALPAAPDAR